MDQRADDSAYADAVRAIDARDYADALDYLESARQRDEHDVRVLNAFGVVYDKLGRFDLSTRYYAQAAALDPASEIVSHNLAYSALLQRQAHREAAPALAAASPPELPRPVEQIAPGIARLDAPPGPARPVMLSAQRLATAAAPSAHAWPAHASPIAQIAPGIARLNDTPLAEARPEVRFAPRLATAAATPAQARSAHDWAIAQLAPGITRLDDAPLVAAAAPEVLFAPRLETAAATPAHAWPAHGLPITQIAPGIARLEAPVATPPVITLPRGLTGRPLELVDASGGRGVEPVRLQLARLGWTTPRTAARATARTTSQIVYAPGARVVALALAHTLPAQITPVACANGCQGVRLVLGSDSLSWKHRARASGARRV
jgi:hypothetical protein